MEQNTKSYFIKRRAFCSIFLLNDYIRCYSARPVSGADVGALTAVVGVTVVAAVVGVGDDDGVTL
jgi:hypothetical protein